MVVYSKIHHTSFVNIRTTTVIRANDFVYPRFYWHSYFYRNTYYIGNINQLYIYNIIPKFDYKWLKK